MDDPARILAKDKLPIISAIRLPTRNKIRVIDSSGREVSPYAVDWNRYSGANIPYQLVQDPGPDNALGVVKIMFPNPYLVYSMTRRPRRFTEKMRARSAPAASASSGRSSSPSAC